MEHVILKGYSVQAVLGFHLTFLPNFLDCGGKKNLTKGKSLYSSEKEPAS